MRSKSISLDLDHPWRVSWVLHLGIAAAALPLFFNSAKTLRDEVSIEVIEAPRQADRPLMAPRATPKMDKPKAREVFGVSRKAITSDEGTAVKQGNTTATAPDQLKLAADDVDSLPIPSDDYLVTQMPALISDVRAEYPPESKKQGIQGDVRLDLLIDSNGSVREVRILTAPNAEMGEAAAIAARGFRFKPARVQENPVAVRIRYTYRFVLEH